MTEQLNNSTTPHFNDVAISVKNLSKSYRMYPSPKDRMKELLHPFGKRYHHEFWALKDVSFEVRKGESIGIIGKNGCGKSTLLQLLCGTLRPTAGEIRTKGRISALLELGAGFNPEFSGRDNVYMNAALMGFSKSEIDERFHIIADFADIGEFIDQPVRIYSSGMFVRLAFAIAVNVDPDILVIDEALSVGDLRFQKKCKEKIRDFLNNGVTIVLVSHAMGDIRTMCNSAMYLNSGRPIYIGDTNGAINAYTNEESKSEWEKHSEDVGSSEKLPTGYASDKGGTSDIFIENFYCYEKGKERDSPEIDFGKNIMIEFEYNAINRIDKPIFRINFSVTGYNFFTNVDSNDIGLSVPSIEGKGRIVFEFKQPNLYPNLYKVNIAVLTEEINCHLFFWNEAGTFVVKPPSNRCMSYPTAIVELEAQASLTHL